MRRSEFPSTLLSIFCVSAVFLFNPRLVSATSCSSSGEDYCIEIEVVDQVKTTTLTSFDHSQISCLVHARVIRRPLPTKLEPINEVFPVYLLGAGCEESKATKLFGRLKDRECHIPDGPDRELEFVPMTEGECDEEHVVLHSGLQARDEFSMFAANQLHEKMRQTVNVEFTNVSPSAMAQPLEEFRKSLDRRLGDFFNRAASGDQLKPQEVAFRASVTVGNEYQGSSQPPPPYYVVSNHRVNFELLKGNLTRSQIQELEQMIQYARIKLPNEIGYVLRTFEINASFGSGGVNAERLLPALPPYIKAKLTTVPAGPLVAQAKMEMNQKVELRNVRLSSEDLAELSTPAFANLRNLTLEAPELDNAAISRLPLEQLDSLSVDFAACDDGIVEALRRFHGTRLALFCPGLDDEGFAKLNPSNLRTLVLASSKLTSQSVFRLGLSSLEALSLVRVKLNEQAIWTIQGIDSLRALQIEFCGIAANTMSMLATRRPSLAIRFNQTGEEKAGRLPDNYIPETLPKTSVPKGTLFWAVAQTGTSPILNMESFHPVPKLGAFTQSGFLPETYLPLPGWLLTAFRAKDKILVSTQYALTVYDFAGKEIKREQKNGSAVRSIWAVGYDEEEDAAYVVGDGLYRFDLEKSEWEKVGPLPGLSYNLRSLAVCKKQNSILMLEGGSNSSLITYDMAKHELSEKLLGQQLPHALPQIFCQEDGTLLALFHERLPAQMVWRLFRIAWQAGEAKEIGYDPDRDYADDIWPGIAGGPTQLPISEADCGPGTENRIYATPQGLLSDHKERLVVVTAQKADCGGASPKSENESCTLNIEVPESKASLVLWLQSESPTAWNIVNPSRTTITKIYRASPIPASVLGYQGDIDDVHSGESAPASFAPSKDGPPFGPFIRSVRKLTGLREAAYISCQLGKRAVIPGVE